MPADSQTLRRSFLASALALPAARLGISGSPGSEAETVNGLPARVLGKTGLKVTTLGFGCAWTSDSSVFTRGLDAGINYFDTAPNYQGGNAETMLRAGIGNHRKQIVLSTKTEAGSKAGALEQLENSFRALGTDYIDIWYLHGKDSPGGIKDDLVEAQVLAKKQGKVRFIGVSTHRLARVTPAILNLGVMDVVLAGYNFTMDAAVGEAADELHKAGIGLVDMKAMAGGKSIPRWGDQASVPRAFERPGVPSASLRWVLKNSLFASALVGMLSMEEVEENTESVRKPFTDADQKVLAARLDLIRPVYCRMCGACDGQCPKGLPVSDVIRFAMYAESYGQFPAAREHFQQLPDAVRAVRCDDCSFCAIRCPNGVGVRQRLTLAQDWLA